MLSADNTQQQVEEEGQTKDKNIQCRHCRPEASPITNSEQAVVKLNYYYNME